MVLDYSKINNQVIWVFNTQHPSLMGSYRLSGIIPAKHLGINQKKFYNISPENFFSNLKNIKLMILAKPFDESLLDLVNFSIKKEIKIISTFDDWNFDDSKVTKKRMSYWLKIAKASNSVVVKTLTAKEVLKKNTDIEAEIIEDCLEFDNQKPISNFSNPIKLCWFGKHTNHDTLFEGIKQLSNYKELLYLNIITNEISPPHTNIIEAIKALNLKKININFSKWNLSFNKEILKSDIVIIPTINDNARLVKSHNRLTESLNLGRFVLANYTPYYSELKDYCYLGNLVEGINWVISNKEEAINKIQEGQKYVLKRFSKEKISKKWQDLIYKNLNAGIRI